MKECIVDVATLVETFSELESSTKKLCQTIALSSSEAVNPLELDGDRGLMLSPLLSGIADFYYEPGQDGRSSKKFPGAIAVSQEALNAAVRVNEIKQLFADQVKQYRRSTVANANIQEQMAEYHQEYGASRPINGTLRRVSIKAATRLIPVCEVTPRLISWSWNRAKRPITRVSGIEAAALLQKAGYDSTSSRIQEEQLSELNELEVALVQKPVTGLYVTFAYDDPAGETVRSKRPASLPLLYFASHVATRFQFRQPDREAPARQRTDKQYRGEPDFSSVRGYLVPPRQLHPR